jgi:hypothetical protein
MLSNIILVAGIILSQAKIQPQVEAASGVVLATHSISMENRYNVPSVNQVFKDNILLSIHYLAGETLSKTNVDWAEIEKPFRTEFTLNPGEEFAFHEHTLPNYSTNVVKTMNTNFMWAEGYKSDGFLVGDGVCHIASIIYWAAKDAGLATYAPSNHNFAKINDVPKEYGVAIESPSPLGNLYITNNLDKPVTFVFDYDGNNLSVSVVKDN